MNRGKVQSNWVEILAIGLVEVLWLLSFHRYKRNMHDSFVTSLFLSLVQQSDIIDTKF